MKRPRHSHAVQIGNAADEVHRVVVALEQRFEQAPDGSVWGPATYSAAFWTRYLEVFDRVRVVARIKAVASPSENLERCGAANVEFAPIPYYIGAWQFLRRGTAVRAAAVESVEPECSVIARIPSPIGSFIVRHLTRQGKPYAVEVVGDPHEVMSPAAFDHPLRPLFRWWLTRQQRSACLKAVGAAYVTERILQEKYPCRGYSVSVSDVHLMPFRNRDAPAFVAQYSSVSLTECVAMPRAMRPGPPARVTLVSIASLSQMYKGVDVLIEGVRACATQGVDVHLVVIGDGKYRDRLTALAAAMGVAGRVRFAGYLPRKQVTMELDAADIFVLPSRTEGLPRALIEAMARGLPCIASDVGGIPELLDPGDLVPPGSARALAKMIVDVALDAQRQSAMSRRNLARAHDFREDVLNDRRRTFYRQVRRATEQWLAGRRVQ